MIKRSTSTRPVNQNSLGAVSEGGSTAKPPATIDIRSSRPLDLAIYGVLVVMGALGVIELSETRFRILAVLLCLAFAVVTTVGPRLARSEAHLVAHFVVLTLIVTALIGLGSNAFDAFAFLFYMLSVHAVLVLRLRSAVPLIALFWIISSAAALWIAPDNAWFTIVFNLGVYPVCGLFGYALREMTVAKRDVEATLAQLRTAQEQLRELAITNERHRLARDLHDSVKQQVFATIMQLGAARVLIERDPAGARKALDEAEQLAQQAGSELSLVIHELRPIALQGKNLGEALTAYLADWSRQSDVRATTRIFGQHPQLPPEVQYALLRVTQEALANVARHSAAEAVHLELIFDDGTTTLMIRDDGQGFDMEQPSGGVGLSSMRERIAALGGTFSLSSESGVGTSITVRLEPHHD